MDAFCGLSCSELLVTGCSCKDFFHPLYIRLDAQKCLHSHFNDLRVMADVLLHILGVALGFTEVNCWLHRTNAVS